MFDLKISEIRKAESLAKKVTKKADCKVTAWYTNSVDQFGFRQVICEICSNHMNNRENDIVIEVCTFDRRRSFCHQ